MAIMNESCSITFDPVSETQPPSWHVLTRTNGQMAVSLVNYASKGNFDKVKECIKNGVDVNASEGSGNSALYYAVLNNRDKTVKFLLNSGANPNRLVK